MYTNNPQMPKIRMEAVRLVKYRGWSTRKVARHFGFTQSAIVKWCKKDPTGGWRRIPTESSKPHHHPKQLNDDVVKKIIAVREKTKRTSEVVHQELLNQGVKVSLNSVRRTIDRAGLMKKRSPWKRYHPHTERPYPGTPGDLVQIDTIHRMIDEKKRLYIFVLLDVCSRWVYAKAYARMNSATTVAFVAEAQRKAQFKFDMLQSDHGPEFGMWFVEQVKKNIATRGSGSRMTMPISNGSTAPSRKNASTIFRMTLLPSMAPSRNICDTTTKNGCIWALPSKHRYKSFKTDSKLLARRR